MKFTRAVIAGAGLAGLSVATILAEKGLGVRVREAAANAGGRCRSYHDLQLDLVIDNGNHLVLSGNRSVARFRERIGASEPLSGPDEASFPFVDLATGERWAVRMNDGPLPWWPFFAGRRAPGTTARDHLALAGIMRGPDRMIGSTVPTTGPLWQRFVEPVMVAVLNTPPAEGSTALAGAVLRETLLKGGRAAYPRIAHPSLAAAFIDPALAYLEKHGATVGHGQRLRAVATDGDRVSALDWGQGPEAVGADEAVFLAVPPWVATALLPDLTAPDRFHGIVNGHFVGSPPLGAPAMLGLIGGTAEWLFTFPDRISVTVSAADHLLDADREQLARTFWTEIQQAYGFEAPMPRWQIVKEKRATFAATPEQNAKRPQAHTPFRNLFLAGDWTATGLPATIEGALRSGETAAHLALGGKRV